MTADTTAHLAVSINDGARLAGVRLSLFYKEINFTSVRKN
jgi:hypothetical protein